MPYTKAELEELDELRRIQGAMARSPYGTWSRSELDAELAKYRPPTAAGPSADAFLTDFRNRPGDAAEAVRDALARSMGRPQASEHPAVEGYGLGGASFGDLLALSVAVRAGAGKLPPDRGAAVMAALQTGVVPEALQDVGTALATSVWAQGRESLRFCREYRLSNYKAAGIGRAAMGDFVRPRENGQIPEVDFTMEGESLTLRHYVAKFAVSLQAMTGDAGIVGALLEQPLHTAMRQMRAGVWGALIGNATLADGAPAFDSTRGNDLTGALDAGGYNAAADALANLALPNSTTLDLEPAFLLCSTANVATARTLNEAMGSPVTVLAHRAVTTGEWFLMPSPEQAPVVALGVPDTGTPLSVEARGMASGADAYVWLHRLDFGAALVSPYAVRTQAS
jgi:hypothetical protein